MTSGRAPSKSSQFRKDIRKLTAALGPQGPQGPQWPRMTFMGFTPQEIAGMRSLHPDKRNLPFNHDGLAAVVEHFKAHYADAPPDMLSHLIVATPADHTWTGMAFGLQNETPLVEP